MKIKKVDEVAKEKAAKKYETEQINVEGSVLKKNVNLFLMVLVMIIVIIGIAYVVLYQNRMQTMTTDVSETGNNLTKCVAALSSARSNLDEALLRLNQTETDVKTYDEIYERKETELADTQDELGATKYELDATKVTLERTQEQYEEAQASLTSLQASYDAALAQIESKNNEIQRLEWEVTCLRGKDDGEEGDC